MELRDGINNYLDISIGHIKKSDADLLGDDETCLVRDGYDYGYWVLVHTDPDSADMDRYGYSEEFQKLVDTAREMGVSWLRLGGDGFIYDDLPMFDW
jgi:hypothetical protein